MVKLFKDTPDQQLSSDGLALDCLIEGRLVTLYKELMDEGHSVRDIEYMTAIANFSVALDCRLQLRANQRG